MTRSTLRLLRLAFLASCLLPIVVSGSSALLSTAMPGVSTLVGHLFAAGLALVLGLLVARLAGRLEAPLDREGQAQARLLDSLPAERLELAIAGSAALGLFLELAMIRWQATVWELFAFYKNLGLLACFIGLGLGYAMAARNSIPLLLVAPLLAFQLAGLLALRYGPGRQRIQSLIATPIPEQLNMGVTTASEAPQFVAIYSFLAVVFLLTALTFVPLGQLCGRLMARLPALHAYRLNLLGSLLGVAAMLGASFLWTPPAVWFAAGFLGLLLFQAALPRALQTAAVSALLALGALSWPVETGLERIYSPYQLIERGAAGGGLMALRAAGHYYQRVHDLSYAEQAAYPVARQMGLYYELPYRVRPEPGRVAVVGAGTGNDVAAALRAGARAVDSIEIDPAIEWLGQVYHPERPYADPRVRRISDDARSFLRTSRGSYDVIAYALLDSHTLLSHASSLRLDSFVYTVEGLREARDRLTEDGILSLSFTVISPEIGRKIYLMMEQTFDGRPPLCVRAGYDGAVLFLQSKRGDLRLHPEALAGTAFSDVTAVYANPLLRADVSTDDWPYFYMPQRVYPSSYLFMAALVLLLCAGFLVNFSSERPRAKEAAFFFLGAGFMLVETKGITEMGLAFGNTWQVIGIMIAGVLLMAYLANGLVDAVKLRRPWIAYLLLLASLAVGLAVSRGGGFAPTPAGRLSTVLVLSVPLFFSGIAFSSSIAGREGISGAMAWNLLGAMCGGLLEYNSMYFGYQSLYWLAMALYVAAFLCSSRNRPGAAAGPASAPAS